MQTSREIAISWFNGLDDSEKTKLVDIHLPTRSLHTITGREIEDIYHLENKPEKDDDSLHALFLEDDIPYDGQDYMP